MIRLTQTAWLLAALLLPLSASAQLVQFTGTFSAGFSNSASFSGMSNGAIPCAPTTAMSVGGGTDSVISLSGYGQGDIVPGAVLTIAGIVGPTFTTATCTQMIASPPASILARTDRADFSLAPMVGGALAPAGGPTFTSANGANPGLAVGFRSTLSPTPGFGGSAPVNLVARNLFVHDTDMDLVFRSVTETLTNAFGASAVFTNTANGVNTANATDITTEARAQNLYKWTTGTVMVMADGAESTTRTRTGSDTATGSTRNLQLVTGGLSGGFDPGDGGRGYTAALNLQIVPEPASSALLAAGAAILVGIHIRRRRL